jgi:hypothetical protein
MAVTAPVINHGSVSTFQVESNLNDHLLSVQARGPNKLTPAGMAAVLTALGSYYSGLTTAQKAATPDFVCHVTAGNVTAYVATGTEATLAAALITAIGTNTVAG